MRRAVDQSDPRGPEKIDDGNGGRLTGSGDGDNMGYRLQQRLGTR